MEKIKVGVLGCTGMVGQQFLRMLGNHPYFEIAELYASKNSAGKIYNEIATWTFSEKMPDEIKDMEVLEIDTKVLLQSKAKIFFSGIPASLALEVEDDLRKEGKYIFSNASSFRYKEDVPILIPEINPEHINLVNIQLKKYFGFIITNSNCTTSGLVFALKPLMKFNISKVFVSSYQAMSGAGRKGIYAMDISGNVIPFIKSEEEKMTKESKKILGKIIDEKVVPFEGDVLAHCARVPVKNGHLESVTIEFADDFHIDDIKSAFNSFSSLPQELKLPTAPEKPVILREEENRPQPSLDLMAGTPDRAQGMAVSIGRLRKEGKYLKLFLLVHNTIRGAAGTCILNAEFATKQGFIK